MAKRRLKIEFNDGDDGNYTFTLEGSIYRDKVLKIMDIVELLGGKQEDNKESLSLSKETSFGKLYHLIEKNFPLGSFTSTDILEAYEDEYRQPVRLSTISTYLSRLQQKRLLARHKTSSGWTYRRVRIKTTQK